jgi:fructose 1,6-bisphosphatase
MSFQTAKNRDGETTPVLLYLFTIANIACAFYSMRKSDDEGNPMVADLLDDPAFALARHEAMHNACMLRRMGEFEPARLSSEEMEYTTIQQVLEKLGERFKPVKEKPNHSGRLRALCLCS